MPSASEFFDQLKGAHAELRDRVSPRLEDIKVKLDALKAATDAVRTAVEHADQMLQWGFSQLITIGNYTNQALYHNNQQNDTIICILEHISKNTCDLVTEAHIQTGLQTTIKNNTTTLAELYEATHAEAALARQKLIALNKKIEECCPPDVPPPACRYEPCPAPRPPSEPRPVDPRPPGRRPPP